MAAAKGDPEHPERLARCLELEEVYTAVMEALPPSQREIIDTYFFACTQVDFRMIHLAYNCGLSESSERQKHPEP